MTFISKLKLLIGIVAVLATGLAAPALAQSSITSQVLKSGVLRVAIAGGNAPFSSVDPSGEAIGYDVDVAKAFAEALKVKPEFIIVDSPGRITSLQTGKADIAAANFTATPERSTAVAFTEPYMVLGISFIVAASSNIKSVEDLNKDGVVIASPRGSTADAIAQSMAPDAKRLQMESVSDATLAVKSGQATAQALDSLAAATLAAKDTELRMLPGTFSYQEVAIGLPAGDFDWWRITNSWVRQFNNSGANAVLYKKWFGVDMPEIR
ncbi:MAG: transporter substrate-binding domain-containing protein [Parvibaculaceae bacterium]